MGVDTASRLKVLQVTEPSKREAGKVVETVQELVAALKKEGVI